MMKLTGRKLIPLAAGTALCIALASVFLLAYTPLRSVAGFTQLVAIDPINAAVLLSTAAASAVAWVVRRRGRTGSRSPRLLILAAVLLLLGMAFAGRVAMQGVADGDPPAEGSALRIVSWNAGGVDVAQIAEQVDSLVSETDANIVVLPETGWKTAQSVNSDLASRRHDFVIFDWDGTATSVLMDPDMARAGEYQMDTAHTPPWAGLEVIPAEPSSQFPIIVAAHFQQGSIGSTSTWLAHLAWAAQVCDSSPYVLVVGDTNSTLNQLGQTSIGSCEDVASATHAGAASTWPSWLPASLGLSIDRFLVGPAWDASMQTFQVRRDISEPGQDHWPIVLSLR